MRLSTPHALPIKLLSYLNFTSLYISLHIVLIILDCSFIKRLCLKNRIDVEPLSDYKPTTKLQKADYKIGFQNVGYTTPLTISKK